MLRRSFANDSTRRRSRYANKTRRGLFPPHRREGSPRLRDKGLQTTTHVTINGRVEIRRRVYWAKGRPSVVPVDEWLGISTERYSPGVREMCCREASGEDFRKVAEDLKRVGQIEMTHETARQIVEREGYQALKAQQAGILGPDWTAADCWKVPGGPTTVITGADGVKVPLVTQAEKAKRRALRRKAGPKARRRRKRMRKGSDQAYKEFKILAYYDPGNKHQYAVGTSGDHNALGRLMRREGAKVGLDRADVRYSVSDGAPWIVGQYRRRLPMLEANVLDYYHLREHVIATSHVCWGEGTAQAKQWQEGMMEVALEEGPVRLVEELGDVRRAARSPIRRRSIEGLQNYVAERMEMLDYPRFRAKGYDIGSGPTEAFCKTLTARLKGPGMRWDKGNAEGMMALASVYSSGLWETYWQIRRTG